jgi:DNA-binding NarL/FixJ family response regulator
MRIVLVGPAAARRRLHRQLPDGIEVFAETFSLSDAGLQHDADAYLVCARPAYQEALVEALTSRETQVLELVAAGLSNRAVAARLGVSDETVKFHLASIFGKLHASNRTDAVLRALRRGLIPL